MTRASAIVLVAGVAAGALAIDARTAGPARADGTQYKLLRFEEDQRGSDSPLKDLQLGRKLTANVGGETRLRYEREWNPGLGAEEGFGRLLGRVLVHGELQYAARARLFVQLSNLWDARSSGGSGPLDETALDAQQAFVEIATDGLYADGLSARLGRQEIALGSGRLFAIRKGPNLRRSFDAARLTYNRDDSRLSVFGGFEVAPDDGVFDDEPDDALAAWGAYGERRVSDALDLEVYYLGVYREDRVFSNTAGREHRHSIGTRLSGRMESVDYNYEALIQLGELGDQTILAWTVATDTGIKHALGDVALRAGLRANVTSGDSDPDDDTAGTFDALFPNITYFSDQVLLFPANFYDLHPRLVAALGMVTLDVGWDFFWRQSVEDGIYTPPGRVLLVDAMSDERFIGHQLNAAVEIAPRPNVEVVLSYSRFFAGDFVRDGGGSSSDFVASWVELLF